MYEEDFRTGTDYQYNFDLESKMMKEPVKEKTLQELVLQLKEMMKNVEDKLTPKEELEFWIENYEEYLKETTDKEQILLLNELIKEKKAKLIVIWFFNFLNIVFFIFLCNNLSNFFGVNYEKWRFC